MTLQKHAGVGEGRDSPVPANEQDLLRDLYLIIKGNQGGGKSVLGNKATRGSYEGTDSILDEILTGSEILGRGPRKKTRGGETSEAFLGEREGRTSKALMQSWVFVSPALGGKEGKGECGGRWTLSLITDTIEDWNECP